MVLPKMLGLSQKDIKVMFNGKEAMEQALIYESSKARGFAT